MKKTIPVLTGKNNILTSKAEQAVLDILPVDQKTLQRTAKLLEPKNLKLIAVGIISGSALISILTSIGHDRIYRAAVSHEMKKQLEPLKIKLNELEAQNTLLYQQNRELREILNEIKQAK